MKIHHLELPNLLLELIETKKWKIPKQITVKELERIFDNHGIGDKSLVKLFDLDKIEAKTAYLLGNQEKYKTQLNPNMKHGVSRISIALDVDFQKMIVIGDLYGNNKFDLLIVPICLYYAQENPSVIYFPDDAFESYWQELYPDFERFAERMEFKKK
jgi:hypothetical protein